MDLDSSDRQNGSRVEALLQMLTGLDAWVLYVVLALLVFGESSAVLALLLPGEVALLVGGALASRGYVDLPLVLLVAFVAAVAGHAAGYEVGRRYGLRLSRTSARRTSRYREAMSDAAALVVRHGGVAVFLGRWMNVSRIVVPLLVGAQRMPYRTFLVFNVLGAMAWVTTFVVLGAVAGASLEAVERVAGQASWWLLGLVAAGVLARLAWRRRRTTCNAPDASSMPDPAATTEDRACTVAVASPSRHDHDA